MRKIERHSKIIEDHLIKQHKNKDSRDTVRGRLWKYFNVLNENPDKYFKKTKKYKNYNDDLMTFAIAIENKPPKTQTAMFSNIKKLFERQDVIIKPVDWDDIKRRNNIKRARPITRKATPTQYDLKKILSYATSIKSKALFVFCASTGMRIDEALKINFDDIDWGERQVSLLDETAKFDIPRITFFTPESEELLKLWLPERKKMMLARYKKSMYIREQFKRKGYDVVKLNNQGEKAKEGEHFTWTLLKNGNALTKEEMVELDNRLFPFEYINAHRMWVTMLEKAGSPYNKRDNNPKLQYPRYHYNIHSMKRFWYTSLSSVGANGQFLDYMGAHSSLLDATYKQFHDNQMWYNKMKEDYDTHMGCLSIFEAQPDLSDVHEEQRQLREENKSLKDDLRDVKLQLLEIRADLYEKKQIKQ